MDMGPKTMTTIPIPSPDPGPPPEIQEGPEGPEGPEPIEMPGPPDPTAAPPRIGLTPSAVDRVREMLVEEELEEEGGLRLTARSGAGCSAPLRVGMILEMEPEEDDVVLSGQGIRIFMDPRSAWVLDGLRVDWVEDSPMGAGFAFQFPRRDGGAC